YRDRGRRVHELDAVPRGEGNHGTLDVEAEQHHVAVLDDIILSFRAQLAGVSRGSLAAERDVIVVSDRLGADEAALEVGVDLSGGFGSLCALVHGPGAGFLWSRSVESDKTQQRISCVDHPIQPRLV